MCNSTRECKRPYMLLLLCAINAAPSLHSPEIRGEIVCSTALLKEGRESRRERLCDSVSLGPGLVSTCVCLWPCATSLGPSRVSDRVEAASWSRLSRVSRRIRKTLLCLCPLYTFIDARLSCSSCSSILLIVSRSATIVALTGILTESSSSAIGMRG